MNFGLIGISLAAGALAFAVPALVHAEDASPWYGSLGYNRSDGQGHDQGAVDARLGWKYNPNFGVEVELDSALKPDHRPPPPGGSLANPHLHGPLHASADVYGVAFLPVTSKFQFLARAGVGESQFSHSALGGSSPRQLSSLNVGVGAQYNFTPHDGLRIDVTHKSYEHGGDTDVTSLNWVHRF